MGTAVESGVRVSDKEKRAHSWGWDEAAEEVCCDGGETRGEAGRALAQTRKHL